jgi:hypothetical protein
MKFSASSRLFVALVLWIAGTQSAPAQTFKHVFVKGGAPLAQIAAGGASVWARASNGNPYLLKGKQFVLANSISLTQIAVSGGNAFQADTVWGLNSAGSIYKAAKSGTTWVFSQVPGVLDFIAVGAGYQDSCHPYEVWGLNTGSEIFRYNFCLNSFDQAPGFLCQIQVGSGDIRGTECGPNVYRFNFSTLSFHQMSNLNLTQLTVGPNGMWGITASPSGNVVQFDDEAHNFYAVGGEPATQIQAGGNGVWGISSSQQIFRLDPSTLSFVHIPGAFVSISVGTGGGVWGLDSSGKAFAFTTL